MSPNNSRTLFVLAATLGLADSPMQAPTLHSSTTVASAPAFLVLNNAEAIPTRLVLPTDPQGYPAPVCSQCKARATKVTSSSTTASHMATISVTYASDDGSGFFGSLEITVRLSDGRYHGIHGTPVSLSDGETYEFELASGQEWTWDDVQLVLVELAPPF